MNSVGGRSFGQTLDEGAEDGQSIQLLYSASCEQNMKSVSLARESSSCRAAAARGGACSSNAPLASAWSGMAFTKSEAGVTGRISRKLCRRLLPNPIYAGSEKVGEDADLSDEYSQVMQTKMGGSLTYEHDLGMNYTRILPNLIVGSCLQTSADAEHLRKVEKVKGVLCLQQDSDMAYFDLDINPVLEACEAVGIDHIRCRVNDFDPYDLRLRLPSGVALLEKAMRRCEEGE